MGDAILPRSPERASGRRALEALDFSRRERLERLVEQLADTPGPGERARVAAARLATIAAADRCSILAPVGPAALSVVASSDSSTVGDLVVSRERYPELERVATRLESIVIPDVEHSELLEPVRELLPPASLRSLAAVPLALGAATGILRLTSRTRSFAEADLDLLEAAAALIGPKLEPADEAAESSQARRLLARVADALVEVAADGRVVAASGTLAERAGLAPGAPLSEVLGAGEETPLTAALDGETRLEGELASLSPEHGPATVVRVWSSGLEGLLPRTLLVLVEAGGEEPGSRLVEDLPVPLLVVDEPGHTVAGANRAAARLFGCEPSELVGEPLARRLAGADADARLDVASGPPVPVKVARSRLEAGGLERSLVALWDLRGVPPSEREALLSSRLERRAEEAKRLRARIDELEAGRARLLGASAHELKTPLTVALAYLETLAGDLGDGLGGEQLELLDVARQSLERLKRLVGDLVDLGALEAGKMQLCIGRADVGSIAEATVSEMLPLARRARIELELGLPARLTPARADPERVGQILRNLLDNALKHTPAGGRVEVGAREEGDSLLVTVADTGSGLPEESFEEAFDEFVQLGPRPAGGDKGSGLGLAISRRIARALGGRLTAVNGEERGAVFTLELPQWPADPEEGS